MNKKDLAKIKKEFKLNSYSLHVKKIYSVYLKKDNGKIISKDLEDFERMDVEKRELYLENFKKTLTGTIDSKIFELNFKDKSEIHNKLYELNYDDNDGVCEFCDEIVDRIFKNYNYETDIVVNFGVVEYYEESKNKKIKDVDELDEYVQGIKFILCSVNKVEIPKKVLKFDYENRRFKYNTSLDITVNLKSPLDGFMFPSFNQNEANLDKIIYYSSKAKKINMNFVDGVLDCLNKFTAEEEKDKFNEILYETFGDTVNLDCIQEIYEKINEGIEESKNDEELEFFIDKKYMERLFCEAGIEDTDKINSIFDDVCGENYKFNAQNIIPSFKNKSIKIQNDDLEICINPRNLSAVKQIVDENGEKFLVVNINENLNFNGFEIKNEQKK